LKEKLQNMSSNPINLAIRFILEISVLFIAAYWRWHQTAGFTQYFLAVGLPLLFASLWGIFTVKGDPSRSGKTIVQTPGLIRLFLELALFGFTCWALFDSGFNRLFLTPTRLDF